MRVLLAFAALAVAAPVQAQWNQTSSKHFVIYADENPKQLVDFAARLERFDQAVRFLRGMSDPPVGQGNRLTVFVLPSVEAVQKLAGNDPFIEGFYSGRASGSVVFVPRKAGEEVGELTADTIFFHEYAHHLMFQVNDRPLPEWVVEGFAEFMSTVRFERDGDIGIGLPAYHRAWGLFGEGALPLESLLAGNYEKITADQRESIYGHGWLLYHYLTFEKSRAGQLDRYIDLIAKGTAPLDAARAAFGDLKQLDRELDVYLRQRKLPYWKLPGAKFQAGDIAVQPLSQGAAKVIALRIQSKRGVDEKTAEPLAAQVRAVETKYPGDELVELTLAEAELDASHPDASEAAADRALKADPQSTKALILKGRAIAERGEKLEGLSRHSAFEQARHLFIAANKIDTEDPEALMQFYGAFVREGIKPTANAVAALHYASDLAPQDEGLRVMSAAAYLVNGKLAEAKHALTPIAYDPHGGELAGVARSAIAKINSGDAKGALAASDTEAASGSSAR
jgi:hypothetical protein